MLEKDFNLKPSLWGCAFFAGLGLATLTIWLFLPLSIISKLIGLIGLLVYSGHLLWRYGLLRKASSIIKIRQRSAVEWLLYARSGEVHVATLQGDSTVTSQVAILRFRTEDKKRFAVIVCKDALESGLYRHLLIAINF